MKVGDTIKILSGGQIIVVDKIKHLSNGKVVVMYHSKDDNNRITKGELYLEVLEMMGIEMLKNAK